MTASFKNMTEPWNFTHYNCINPPTLLWRVVHSSTQSRQDPLTGDLIASDNTRIISNRLELKQAIKAHIDWRNRQPTCFLSVFSDKQHALNWAKQREEPQSKVYIYKIDTTNLPADTYLFDADLLKAMLGFVHPTSTHELLFLHRIPAQSIIIKRGLEEIMEQEVVARARAYAARAYAARAYAARVHAARAYAARSSSLSYYRVGKLGRCYDSDEECEENNRCDDSLNIIEGHWD